MSGTRFSLQCPRSSSWREGYQEIYIDDIDLTRHDNYEAADSELFYTENKYQHLTILHREWSLKGSLFDDEYLGVMSLTIKLLHIPMTNEDDCMFIYDKLTQAIPALMNIGNNDGIQSLTSAGGQLSNNRNVGYNRKRVSHGHPDQEYDRTHIVIDCEHLLLLEFYNAKAPFMDHFTMGRMKEFTERMIESIQIIRSDEIEAIRRNAIKTYAEKTGAYYDEEYGDILVPLAEFEEND